MKRIVVHTDGGARGNPGPSGIGITIVDEEGNTLKEISEYIGEGTNNVAEYIAVKRAFEHLFVLFPDQKSIKVDFFLDSQLVERQLNGIYKIKEPSLKVLASETNEIREHFGKVTFTHIRREENKRADELANEAMDEVSKRA